MTQPRFGNLDRRRHPRYQPRNSTRARCFRGSLGLGANLAVRVLDLSEGGARLLLRESLSPGQEIEVTLESAASPPVKVLAEVVWAQPGADGHCTVGARFRKQLGHADLMALARR
jgi:hypothetical protein